MVSGVAPKNDLVAFLGDSITINGIANGKILGHDETVNAVRNVTRGMLFWLPFLTHQRFKSRQDLVFAASGDTSEKIHLHINKVIEAGVGTCVIMAGTNDFGRISYESTISSLDKIYSILSQENILIIAYPIIPRSTYSAPEYGFICRVNNWIRTGCSRYAGFRFMDTSEFGDPYDVTYSPKRDYSWDGLHPTGIGMRVLAQPAADFLNTLLPRPEPLTRSNIDHFQEFNPSGYVNSNPQMGGAGGFLGPGVSGVVADDYSLTIQAEGGIVNDLRVAASKSVNDRNRATQRIKISGTGTGGYATRISLTQDGFGRSEFRPGDTIEALAELSTAGDISEIAGVALMISTTQDEQVYYVYDGYPIISDLWSQNSVAGVLKTPAMMIKSETMYNAVALMVYLRNSTSKKRSLSIDIEGIVVRKIQ